MWNCETVIPYDGCGPKIGKVKKKGWHLLFAPKMNLALGLYLKNHLKVWLEKKFNLKIKSS